MIAQLTKATFLLEGRSGTEIDDQQRIWVDGVEIFPDASQQIRNHSPGGFNWGYGGSGPAQAALAICLHLFGDKRIAEVLYQEFKRAFVAHWQPAGADFVAKIDLTDFLIDNRHLIQREAELAEALRESIGEGFEEE